LNTKLPARSYDQKLQKESSSAYILDSALPQSISLIDSINQLMLSINTQHHLCIEFIHCGFENENCLKNQDRVAIYLIVKAQIKNILKNARATSAVIHLAKNQEKVAIVIEDNGADIDTTKIKKSRSITTIQNLVKYHKGQCNIVFEQNKGTVLEVLINVTGLSK
jgi:signal transduction histidine kinase